MERYPHLEELPKLLSKLTKIAKTGFDTKGQSNTGEHEILDPFVETMEDIIDSIGKHGGDHQMMATSEIVDWGKTFK